MGCSVKQIISTGVIHGLSAQVAAHDGAQVVCKEQDKRGTMSGESSAQAFQKAHRLHMNMPKLTACPRTSPTQGMSPSVLAPPPTRPH